jgi:hypothetical protein
MTLSTLTSADNTMADLPSESSIGSTRIENGENRPTDVVMNPGAYQVDDHLAQRGYIREKMGLEYFGSKCWYFLHFRGHLTKGRNF